MILSFINWIFSGSLLRPAYRVGQEIVYLSPEKWQRAGIITEVRFYRLDGCLLPRWVYDLTLFVSATSTQKSRRVYTYITSALEKSLSPIDT